MITLIIPEAYNSVGGIQKYNRNIIEVLIQEHTKSTVLSLNDKTNFQKGTVKFKGFQRSKIKFFIFSILYSLKNKKIVIGHLNFLLLALFIKIFNPFSKIFLILYGIECWKKLSLLEKVPAKLVDEYISISNFSKTKFLELNTFLKNKKNSILHPCIDFDKKIDESENLPSGKIILSVSRLAKSEKYKGIENVIKVMPEILKEIPDAYYVIIGDGDDRENLEKLSEKLNIKDRVIFKGFLPDEKLNFYYKNCNLFILPSKKEGFGIVFLEALSSGKPVIAGNKDGSKEALLNGELGILIDPDSPEEIKYSIIKVLKKEADKKLFNEKYLKSKLKENFGIERLKEKLMNILKTK